MLKWYQELAKKHSPANSQFLNQEKKEEKKFKKNLKKSKSGVIYIPVTENQCRTVVQWLPLLCDFIHQSLNAGSAGDLRWRGSLTMVPAGNKAKRLSSINHAIKTIRYHNHKF